MQELELVAGGNLEHAATGSMPAGVALGLAATEASLARNLLLATPTEHDRSSSSSIRRRIILAMAGPSPRRRREPVTSRNASSSEGLDDRRGFEQDRVNVVATSPYRS